MTASAVPDVPVDPRLTEHQSRTASCASGVGAGLEAGALATATTAVGFGFTFDPPEAATAARDYQRELVTALGDWSRPHRPSSRGLIHVATGGGKTRVLSDFIVQHVLSDRNLRILVVTKDWELLRQSAEDLCRRHECGRGAVSFVGGASGRRAFAGLPFSASARVVFTTVQTWLQRRHTTFASEQFDFIAIDELHWGEGAVSYDALLERHHHHAMFLGLTATPRRWTNFALVGQAFDLERLVNRGFLARPVVLRPCETGTNWSPAISVPTGDIASASLDALAGDAVRNTAIIETYVRQAPTLGKTILFACNIAHAEALANGLSARGVRAAAIHSKLPPDEKKKRLDDFRASRIGVAVNVAMLTHGIDIPDIQSVMLARPTTSDILFSQMIGRATRKTEGKDFFYIMDCVDNVPLHGVPIVRPHGFLGTAALGPTRRSPARPHHEFGPVPLRVVPVIPGYEDLAGLEIQPSQTFGIEFELAERDGRAPDITKAQALLEALRRGLGGSARVASRPMSAHSSPDRDDSVWNVEPDPSCGWEVTSRVLGGEEGFLEVVDACRAIGEAAAQLGLVVNSSTGTHVHLGWKAADADGIAALRRLLDIAAYYEPALRSLVAPSRARNQCTVPVRRHLRAFHRLETVADWRRHYAVGGTRYVAVNPAPLFRARDTVEVRLHSGTIEAVKILTWLSLWMRIFSAAADVTAIPGDPFRRQYRFPLMDGPRGDIRDLCRFVGAGSALERKLVARRDFVLTNSWLRHRVWGALASRLARKWNLVAPTAETSPPVGRMTTQPSGSETVRPERQRTTVVGVSEPAATVPSTTSAICR